MTPSSGASKIAKHRQELTRRITEIVVKRSKSQARMTALESSRLEAFLTNKIANLLQTWEELATDKPLDYQRETKTNAPLLHNAGRKSANDLTSAE